MATILARALDKRREKKNGTFPLCLRLNWAGKQSYINLGVSIESRYWSQEFGRVTRSAPVKPSPTAFNESLQKKLSEALSLIEQLSAAGTMETMSHPQLYQFLKNGSAPKGGHRQITLSAYLDQITQQYEQAGNLGQASVYKQAKGFLTRYGDKGEGQEYRFEDLSYRLLRLMEYKFQSRGPGNMNGLSFYLRTLRASFNRAIKEEVVSAQLYPFKKYQIKKSKTHKTAITMQEIERILALDLPVGTLAWHGRNLFMFSFHCRGMNFADIATLRYSNIERDRLVYVRKKTAKRISILINAPIAAILALYCTAEHEANGYIFPIITVRGDDKKAHAQTMIYLGSVNHALKRWAQSLGLPRTLSFNTARHSWATIGRNMNLPIAIISQGLGHSDVETTTIYLDEFDMSAMDQASDALSLSVGGTDKGEMKHPL